WAEAAGHYGERLRVAFQINDDLLGYTSDTLTMGKSAASDVRNRRFTLPLIYARAAADAADSESLGHIYSGQLEPDEALRSMKEVLLRTGGIAAAERTARANARDARKALEALPPS